MTNDRIRAAALVPLYAFAVATPFSTAAGSILGVTILVLGLIALAVHAPARAAVPRVVVIGVAGMILWSAIAAATASPFPTKWEPWAQEVWIKLMMVAAIGLMVFARVRVERLLLVYVVAASVVAILGYVQYATGTIPFNHDIPPTRGDRWEIEGYFDHHLTYGGHVAVLWMVALARAVFERGGGLRRRLALLVPVGMLGLALYWSYARSPQLGALAGIGVLALFLPPRRRLVAIVVVLAGVGIALADPTMRDRYTKIFDVSSEQTRVLLWSSSLDGIEERPWTGFGPGNFHEMMAVHEVPGEYNTRAHAHNDYIMHAVNGGVPMLGFALVLAGGIAVVLWRRRRWPSGAVDWVVAGALAAHVVLFVGGLVQVFQTDDEVEFTLYFVLAAALAHLASRDPSRGAPSGLR